MWIKESKNAFKQLKKIVIEALVLKLPYFYKEFVLEVDACGRGIKATVMQENQSIAYIQTSLQM